MRNFIKNQSVFLALLGMLVPACLFAADEKPDQPWKSAAFSQYLRPGKDKFMGRSIRADRWRYTEWANGKNESVGVELYDEETDPKENANIAREPANQAIATGLAAQLKAGWRAALLPGPIR